MVAITKKLCDCWHEGEMPQRRFNRDTGHFVCDKCGLTVVAASVPSGEIMGMAWSHEKGFHQVVVPLASSEK